jgi:hypothetical protein
VVSVALVWGGGGAARNNGGSEVPVLDFTSKYSAENRLIISFMRSVAGII